MEMEAYLQHIYTNIKSIKLNYLRVEKLKKKKHLIDD